MKRVKLHRVDSSGTAAATADRRYIVEVFDALVGERSPVALGYAVVGANDGVRSINIVSRAVHDDAHARDAMAALQALTMRPGGDGH